MKAAVTPQAETAIGEIAQRHGISREAVLAMLYAVHAGGGTMAQFAIPELGGSGQWMRGGMTMVGDMFDNALKARVDALCNELAQLQTTIPVFPAAAASPTGPSTASGYQAGFSSGSWWPADLGVPSSSGGQNDARYAVFPGTRRLAIQTDGHTRVFDTGEHQINAVQQQQGSVSAGSVTFTSQFGTFSVSSLTELGRQQVAETPTAGPAAPPHGQSHPAGQSNPAGRSHPAPPAQAPAPAAGTSEDPGAIVAAIESLAGLHERGILSDTEFASKKAELLSRL